MGLKHLVKLLILLAVLVAPAGMLGSHMAMAAPQAMGAPAGSGHCAETAGMSHHQAPAQEAPDGEAPKQNIDCFIACSCIPAPGAHVGERASFAEPPAVPALRTMGRGLNPEADPPPPRLS